MIDRDDYGELMMFYFPYCPDLHILLQDCLCPGDICYDLGANIGLLAFHMSLLVGSQGFTVAVEPNPDVSSRLKQTINQCALQQIAAYDAAIGAETKHGWFTVPDGATTASGMLAESGVEVRILTIDDLVAESGKIPHFIKVDIEGSEIDLIPSMRGLLSQSLRPTLLVEFHPSKCLQHGLSAERLYQDILDLGYEARVVAESKSGYLLRQPLAFREHENILFMTEATLLKYPILNKKWRG